MSTPVNGTSSPTSTSYSLTDASRNTTTVPSSSQSRQQNVSGALSGLRALPTETLEKIVGHADPASLPAFARADPHAYERVAPDVQASLIRGRGVPQTTTPAGVSDMRQRIAALPARLQAQPKAALGAQIGQLPQVQQFAIRDDFQRQIRSGTATAQQVIDRHGITDPGMIRVLQSMEEHATTDRYYAMIRGGATAQQVIDRHGITDLVMTRMLREVEQETPQQRQDYADQEAISGGATAQQIIIRRGITDPHQIRRLEYMEMRFGRR
jgi:hypothetical protein